jgi:hypothetical protein
MPCAGVRRWQSWPLLAMLRQQPSEDAVVSQVLEGKLLRRSHEEILGVM